MPYLTLFLLVGSGLALGRVVILYLLDSVWRGTDGSLALRRLAHEIDQVTVHALTVSALAVAISRWQTRRRQPRMQPRMQTGRVHERLLTLGVCILVAALIFSALSGWPVAASKYVPGASTARGLLALEILAGGSVAASALLLLLVRFVASHERCREALANRVSTAGAVAVAVLAPCTFFLAYRSERVEQVVREIVREIAFETDWLTSRSHPLEEPEAGVITPLPDGGDDGRDRVSLLMPRPCEVSFRVEPSDGPAVLDAAAGVDYRWARRVLRRHAKFAIGFEVLVNDEVVFREEVRAERDDPTTSHRWIPVRNGEGVDVVPGDRVTLRTDWLAPDAAVSGQPPVVRAGFGGLVLRRDTERVVGRSSRAAPNIVLIVVDTLRADRMSCYGYERETTPAIDRLARQGLVFDNAFSTSSWTWPSTASILTGLPPERHDVMSHRSCYLRSSIETLPELLLERGFITCAFSCNPLIVPKHDFSQGFGLFNSGETFRPTPKVLYDVHEWIELNAGARFFLYMHFVDPHAPYYASDKGLEFGGVAPPSDFKDSLIAGYMKRLVRGEGLGPDGEPQPDKVVPPEHQRWIDNKYDASVFSADDFVGAILEQLERLGLSDETIIAFTSDHGEELFDHGLLGHGNTLHRELVRVPLILAGPGLPRGRRVAQDVSNRHLAPTLARLGGTAFTQLEEPLDLATPDALPRRPVHFSTDEGWWNGSRMMHLRGVTDGEWVLHQATSSRAQEVGRSSRLYDVAEDVHEHTDLAASDSETTARLDALIRARSALRRSDGRRGTVGVGADSAELLRAIGYVDTDDEED